MLNKNLKKEANEELKLQMNEHNKKFESTVLSSKRLHDLRIKSIAHIEKVEELVNSLANRPINFDSKLKKIELNKKNFADKVSNINREQEEFKVKAGIQVAAGAAAGVGVAALGPSAAMAIATTFGTASTGTAITSLSGAAATNAALAWIGGGPLAAGGGGMAGGGAFLALSGPVGIGIAGIAIVGSGVLTAKENKKVAAELKINTEKIKKEVFELNKIEIQIKLLNERTKEFLNKNDNLFESINNKYPKDYKLFTIEQKEIIGSLVNNTHSMSRLIIQKVGEKC